MALFQYKGVDRSGKEIKGTVSSDSMAQAKLKIMNSGIMLLNIKEKSYQAKSQHIPMGGRVSIGDLSLMTRQLSTLIKAKIPLAECLASLVDQVESGTLRQVLGELGKKINEGSSLAKALTDYPKIFNNVYINMVEAGEASGTLDIVLLRLAEFTEAQVKLKNKVLSAMMYPAIMASVGFLMMVFIFIFIIPKITKIFVSMKTELPLPTKICIHISYFMQHYWWAVLGGIPLSIYLLNRYVQTINGQKRWHRLQLKLPIVGTLITMVNVSRFCSTLATLLNAGVPILASLEIVKNLLTNVHMQQSMREAKISVSEGASMVTPLMNSGLFPPLVTHMIRLGEKSGELESMLEIVAENYEDQVNTRLDGLTSTLEPIMMVCLGGVVAFIVVSIIVPMMNLYSLKR